MRVLHVSDSYRPSLGGIQTQVHRLAWHQRNAGDESFVLTSTAAHPGQHGRSLDVDDGVPVFRLTARVPGNLPIHGWPLPHARELLDRLRPDVVHFHVGGVTPTTQAIIPLAVARGIAGIVTVHSVWRPRTAIPLYAALDRAVGWSRWPIVLTAVSELAARPVRRASGGRAEVGVLRNGVDIPLWRTRQAPGPESVDRPLHAVSAGRFAPRKRMLELVRALLRAHRADGVAGRLQVTLAGVGPQLEAARTLVRAAGAESWLRLPGRFELPALIELYRTADVYLAPGVDDAFSVAVQEARAAGLAIVSRSQSGAAELLVDEVDGLLAHDDDALSAAVVQLVRDRALLHRILAHNYAVPPPTQWPAVLAEATGLYRSARSLIG
ncbi:glycosyltransferase family 4 protein [Georgenia sp. MJ170]|uniref:glycosyltransferase family 4 protein n=1 Tax=Georgenia sunbinii TaxID=3117728 RepID=UPI002F261B68